MVAGRATLQLDVRGQVSLINSACSQYLIPLNLQFFNFSIFQSPLVDLAIPSREYRQQCLTKHNWWDISVPLIHTLTNSFTYSSFFAFRHRLQHLHGRKDFRHSEAKVPMDPTKPFAQISHLGQYQRFQRDNDETSCKGFLFGSHVGYYGWKREDIWVRALLWVKREDIWVRDLLWDIKRGYLGKRFTMGEKERIFR